MKIAAFTAAVEASNRHAMNNPPPPIPFKKVERATPKKAACTEFKLFARPDDLDSTTTYTIEIRHFKTGTPEEWIDTTRDIMQVLEGLRIDTADAAGAIVRTILKGEALRLFEDGINTIEGLATMHDFRLCMEHITKHVFPARSYIRQKRYMRREMKKTRDVSIREFVVRVREMNTRSGLG
jgi:hypothetical protein